MMMRPILGCDDERAGRGTISAPPSGAYRSPVWETCLLQGVGVSVIPQCGKSRH